MKKTIIFLISGALAGVLGACDFLMGPDNTGGNGGENLSISFGTAGTSGNERAISSGAELPAEVLASLRYELSLTGPGDEVLKRTVSGGETLKLTAALGEWRIDAEAYQEDGLAGTGSHAFTVAPGLNTVLVPMWINRGYFDLTVDSRIPGGTVEASFSAAFPGTTVTLRVTPEEGYVLQAGTLKVNDDNEGIAGSGETYTFTMPAADVTVSAVFEAIGYGITYHNLDGAANAETNPAAYTVAELPITLDPPARPGYAFGGWYDNSELSGTAAAGIPAGSTGDKSFYAKWTAINYSITVDDTLSGGTISPYVDFESAASATIGTTVTLRVTPNPEYVLKTGSLTYTYNDGSERYVVDSSYTFTMPAADVTVSAVFTRQFNITIEGPADQMPAVNGENSNSSRTPATDISYSAGEYLTFTVDDTAYTYEAGTLKWYVDGVEITPASGSSLVVQAKGYSKRSYTLTAMIKKDGIWYSGEAQFTVIK